MVSQNGVSYPVVNAGVGKNPQASAYEAQQQNAKSLSSLGKVGGGTVVPQMTMGYTPSNGSNDPNSQITMLTKIGSQQNANAQLDKHITAGGGKRRFRRRRRRTYKKRKTNKKKSKKS